MFNPAGEILPVFVYFIRIKEERRSKVRSSAVGRELFSPISNLLFVDFMQKSRIFIAINLPEDIKKKFAGYQRKWPKLPIRWTKTENLHITLEFIGYVDDGEILEICQAAKKAASKHNPFLIKLTDICYGPLNKKPPKMVWAIGEESRELASLRNDLEKSLSDFPGNSQSLSVNDKERKFSPHITLGRIRQWEWRRIEPEERPAVEESVSLTFEARSIEVMESRLKRGGSEYIILESARLG